MAWVLVLEQVLVLEEALERVFILEELSEQELVLEEVSKRVLEEAWCVVEDYS